MWNRGLIIRLLFVAALLLTAGGCATQGRDCPALLGPSTVVDRSSLPGTSEAVRRSYMEPGAEAPGGPPRFRRP